jgi:hypothetical protein
MKDPNPPTLLRLRATVAIARYHEALNLEGLDTAILDGAPVSPLALAKISMPASCHRKSTWEGSSRGCAFSVCTSVNRFIFLSATTTTSTSVSAGFFFMATDLSEIYNWYSIFDIGGGDGLDYAILHIHPGAMHLETDAGITKRHSRHREHVVLGDAPIQRGGGPTICKSMKRRTGLSMEAHRVPRPETICQIKSELEEPAPKLASRRRIGTTTTSSWTTAQLHSPYCLERRTPHQCLGGGRNREGSTYSAT